MKKVAGYLGVSMTKTIFAGGVAKAIPVAGALLGGGLTVVTFLPMSKRLQKHLAGSELTDPGFGAAEGFVVDGDVIDDGAADGIVADPR